MAISNVPTLPGNIAIVDPATGYPSVIFARWWQDNVANGLNALVAVANAQAAADNADAAAATANAAAAVNATAAAAANAAAAAAQAQADAAAVTAAANAREAALVNSYITPSSVLTCTPAVITVAAHTRNYGDGTSVAVSAGTVATTSTGPVVNYVSYSDPARAGGAVTYIASTAQPTQGSDIHVVGAITVPATGTATGGNGPSPPGHVIP